MKNKWIGVLSSIWVATTTVSLVQPFLEPEIVHAKGRSRGTSSRSNSGSSSRRRQQRRNNNQNNNRIRERRLQEAAKRRREQRKRQEAAKRRQQEAARKKKQQQEAAAAKKKQQEAAKKNKNKANQSPPTPQPTTAPAAANNGKGVTIKDIKGKGKKTDPKNTGKSTKTGNTKLDNPALNTQPTAAPAAAKNGKGVSITDKKGKAKQKGKPVGQQKPATATTKPNELQNQNKGNRKPKKKVTPAVVQSRVKPPNARVYNPSRVRINNRTPKKVVTYNGRRAYEYREIYEEPIFIGGYTYDRYRYVDRYDGWNFTRPWCFNCRTRYVVGVGDGGGPGTLRRVSGMSFFDYVLLFVIYGSIVTGAFFLIKWIFFSKR